MSEWQYQYLARLVRVVDGDTVVLEIDLGFHIKINHHVRLYGINAPEMNTPEGVQAKLDLINKLGDRPIMFLSHKDKPDKYGRLLGTLFMEGKPVV